MRKALGKGLDALLPPSPVRSGGNGNAPEVRRVPIEAVKANRLQPRKNFDAERLSELAQSIKEHGLAQPIVVSYDSISNSYELIAGERRLRASQLAGLSEIEVVVRTPKSDKERLALALIENIQRDNLNAIETARAYKRLMDEFEVNQTMLAQQMGKSKSAISNTLRLLDLSDDMQKAVQYEQLTEGHARALLMVVDPMERSKLFKYALEQHLSVRKVEQLAQQIAEGMTLAEVRAGKKPGSRTALKSADIEAMEKRFEKAFGTKVEIKTRKDEKSGRIVIHFYNLEDFDNILKVIEK